MVERMNHYVKTMSGSGIRAFTAMAKATEDCAMLTIGEPDFNTPDAIKDACKAALDRNETHYPVTVGDLRLREKISEFERRTRGLSYNTDEIIVTDGASEALFTALHGILDPGDQVVIPTPAFGLYAAIVEMAGGIPVFLDTTEEDFQISAEKLSACLTDRTKALILTSPNNPTGCVYTQATLDAVHDLVKDLPIFILCDDVYNRIVYGPCPGFYQFQDLRDRLLLIQSFSKPYAMTGWRMGYLMADKPVAKKLALYHGNVVVSVSSICQSPCITALDCDISEMVASYRRRRDHICARLDEIGLPYVMPQGAFYVFPSVRDYTNDTNEFCTRMIREGKVAVVPGACFNAEGYIRLSYCYSLSEIDKAMDRLGDFLLQNKP